MPLALECCICYDTVSSPGRLTRCQHMICGACTGQLQSLECPTCRAPLAGGYVTSPIRNTISSRIAANSNAAILSNQAFSYIINRYQDQLPQDQADILARAFQESYSSFLDEHPFISEHSNERMIKLFHNYLNLRDPRWISNTVSSTATDNTAIVNLNAWGREFLGIGDALLDDHSLRLRELYPIYFSS